MTATAHAIVAAAIASNIRDPATAYLLSFTSHFIMDSVPHWDIGTNWRKRSKHETGILAIAETLTGMVLGLVFFWGKAHPVTLFLCIFLALIPDWLETPWYIFFASPDKTSPGPQAGFLEKCTYGIYKLENSFHNKMQFPMGLVTQIVTVAFFLFLLS